MTLMDNVIKTEAAFQGRVASINRLYELVLDRSENYLSTLDSNPKPSVFRLQRYLNACQQRLVLLKEEKDDGCFGVFIDRPELTEIENRLEVNISKLQASKKELEDKGYKNIADLICNNPPPLELLQKFEQVMLAKLNVDQ